MNGTHLPPTTEAWTLWLESSLADLHRRQLFRTLRPTLPTASPVEFRISEAHLAAWLADAPTPPPASSNLERPHDTKTIKLFSLNDYLGLSTHPRVCEAMARAASLYGSGPRSSALVGGYTAAHRDLELALANLKGTEDSLLCPTGFAANLAVLSAIGSNPNVDIFSDELNHASIVDGARLARRAGAGVHVYRHNDVAHLESLLYASAKPLQIVVTDSLFSMDGDYADLGQLAALRRRHGCLLAVDEAHATLVCGASGAGVAEAQGVEDQIDLHVGTLSKAFGSVGGFVACSRRWKDLLVNRGRAQIFSTALPVPVVEAASTALVVARDEPWRREHVLALAQKLGGESPIVPIVVGEESSALTAGAALLRRGMHVPAIRPPTVPVGSSRLRVSLSAAHSTEDVDALVVALREVVPRGYGRLNKGLNKGLDHMCRL